MPQSFRASQFWAKELARASRIVPFELESDAKHVGTELEHKELRNIDAANLPGRA
jgi:hypothetical protein